ncbi:MAG: uracil phosphoribosyltransferase [Bacteroidia bacterium]|nr:uracil phosphoribosyltransferase [Bacteroidia bacterium]NNM23537.1 uracil phosphoribosyltransferase [Flavobacteriaceae bacterium]
MSWKGFFEGIQDFAEAILFVPYEALRAVELDNWWMANIVSWLFLATAIIAFFYWMKTLAEVNARGEEDRTQVSHSFLGEE